MRAIAIGEQADALEDVGAFGEEAEDQPHHKVVHVVAARGSAPIGVVFQKFDIEPVQAAGGADVEGAFTNLFDGRDAGQRQEETEMIGKVLIGAGDRIAVGQIFGLESVAVRRQNKLSLGFYGRRTCPKRGQKFFVTAPGGATTIWMLLV